MDAIQTGELREMVLCDSFLNTELLDAIPDNTIDVLQFSRLWG
jgi:hypothetical protein